MSDNVPELAETIAALRGELTLALEEGKDKEVRFGLGPVELEFQVEVTKEAKAEGGVKFWVVNLGAQAGVSSGSTHTVRLSLQPVADGTVLEVAAEAPRRPK